MKLKHLVGSALATSALACGPADADTSAPEVLGTERAELVKPGSNGVLVFARAGEATVMALKGNNFLGKVKHSPGGTWWPTLTGDFNGDGQGDIVWRQATDGRLSFWRMFGNRQSSWAENPTSPRWDAGYGTPMAADFNDDGVDDILWQGLEFEGQVPNHVQAPVSDRWTMAASSAVPTEVVSSQNGIWWAEAAGRFWADGSNRANLFWVSGNGGTRIEALDFGSWEGPSVDPNWLVEGVADFDANGSDDILWRHRDTGDFSIWPMEWGWPQSFRWVGNVPTTWNIAGAGDLDGDNIAEIIWRDGAGNVAVTLLNPDYTVKSYGPAIPLGTDYRFVGVMRTAPKFGHARLDIFKPRSSGQNCIGNWWYTITPTNGPPYTVWLAGTAGSNFCRYRLEMVDIQDTYTVTFRDGGCFKATIMGGESSQYSQNAGNWCAPLPMPPPTMPPPTTPPQPPQSATSGAVMKIWGGGAAPMDDGYIWHQALFPPQPIITGRAVSITNPNSFLLAFPKLNYSPDDCGDSSKVVTLGAQASTTAQGMEAIFGTPNPSLPITLTACAATLPVPDNVIVNVTHVR